jgi:hypothetical protein
MEVDHKDGFRSAGWYAIGAGAGGGVGGFGAGAGDPLAAVYADREGEVAGERESRSTNEWRFDRVLFAAGSQFSAQAWHGLPCPAVFNAFPQRPLFQPVPFV